jgi:hypothetical protein
VAGTEKELEVKLAEKFSNLTRDVNLDSRSLANHKQNKVK